MATKMAVIGRNGRNCL